MRLFTGRISAASLSVFYWNVLRHNSWGRW